MKIGGDSGKYIQASCDAQKDLQTAATAGAPASSPADSLSPKHGQDTFEDAAQPPTRDLPPIWRSNEHAWMNGGGQKNEADIITPSANTPERPAEQDRSQHAGKDGWTIGLWGPEQVETVHPNELTKEAQLSKLVDSWTDVGGRPSSGLEAAAQAKQDWYDSQSKPLISHGQGKLRVSKQSQQSEARCAAEQAIIDRSNEHLKHMVDSLLAGQFKDAYQHLRAAASGSGPDPCATDATAGVRGQPNPLEDRSDGHRPPEKKVGPPGQTHAEMEAENLREKHYSRKDMVTQPPVGGEGRRETPRVQVDREEAWNESLRRKTDNYGTPTPDDADGRVGFDKSPNAGKNAPYSPRVGPRPDDPINPTTGGLGPDAPSTTSQGGGHPPKDEDED